ncbi:MAG TPA: 6-hydroxymethylpterin diphosphokinase MptE-like protein [Tepidisphaeraceae bacterium]|jgi:hypothetical protein
MTFTKNPPGPARYVLGEDAPLVKNLAALWTIEPALAEAIEALHSRESYPVQQSKAGPATVAVPAPGGRSVALHSRYQPIEEAKRLIDPIPTAERLAFYVFGFALGYHVELLFERAGKDALLLVFEPDLLLLRTSFEQRDYSHLIESRRVMFFHRLEKGDLLARLTPHTALISVGAEQVVHPPSMEVAGEFHRQMQVWIEEYASFGRTSLNTVVLNSRKTAQNIAKNIAWYIATPPVSRLHDRHRGKPAVIVSAGPSLRKNKHLLPKLKGHAVLIATQTMLKPMLEMGVEPDYVTSLDYHEICTRFFEKLPPNLGTELVAEPKATGGVFRLHTGPVTLLGNRFAELILREMKPNKTELPGGATVAHLAFYLAEYMGSDPIIFVGQDLGFSDGLCYAPGTSYEDVWRPELSRFCTVEMKQWEQIVRERYILRRIPDYQGRAMYTEERLFTYLQQFEKDFAATKACVIDATEGGAAKRGATPMTLADAIGQFCAEPLPTISQDHRGLKWGRVGECIELIEKRREEGRQIEEISRQTLPLLEEIRDHIENQARVNRAIGEIDGLRARMNGLGPTYDLVTELTQSTQFARFEADRKISAAKVDGIERQRRQVARDIENVRGVAEAAREFQVLMGEVVEQIARELPRVGEECRRV